MEENQSLEPYELIVPGEPRSLSLIRMVVKAVAREAGLSDEQIDRVEVAVDEACSNVIEHGYGSLEARPPVEIVMQAQEKQFIVDVVDSGPFFDFDNSVRNRFPDHWMDGDNIRGAGLYLMMSLMDSIGYERLPDTRNRMRLVKKIA